LKKFLFVILSVLAFEANAQVSDTIKKDITNAPDTVKHLHSRSGSIIVPVALVGYGFLSFAVKPIRNFDYYVRDKVAVSNPNTYAKVSDFLQLSPVVLVYGLNLVGVEGKNRFVDRTALLALSGGILTVADGLKFVAHRQRPYGTDPLSFPSGHTGAAFLAAEYLAQEYDEKSPWYGIAGYTVATATGVLRLYGQAHWFSDCVAGAGLGILSTKAAYLVYPAIRKVFTHKDKQGRSTMLMPTYQGGMPGFSFAMQL